MKKICPECGKVNEYEAEKCSKCGTELDKASYKKVCPQCGREYPLVREICEECKEKLTVCGTAKAQVFDEKRVKGEVPVWVWLVGLFLPILGIIISCVFAIIKEDNNAITKQDMRQIILFSIFGQLILAGIIYVIVIFLTGTLGEGVLAMLEKQG